MRFLPASVTSMEGSFHGQHRVSIGSRDGGLTVKHGHRLDLGHGRLSPGGRGGGCDCGALRKVRLTLGRLQHVCTPRKGCVAKELKLLSLQLGQG